MAHPLKEGVYWISLYGDTTRVERVAALEGDDDRLVRVISDDLPIAFSYKIWRLKFSGPGYSFQNVATNKYVFAPHLTSGAPVYLDKEQFTTFDIQPDGKDIWRVVVPEHDLDWTGIKFSEEKAYSHIGLSGSGGSDNQRFTFQLHAGP